MCHVLNRDKVDIFRTQRQRHEPKLLGVPHEQPLSTHHQPAHDLRQRGEAACWVSVTAQGNSVGPGTVADGVTVARVL